MAKGPKAPKSAKAGGGKAGGLMLLVAGLGAGVALSYALSTAILLGLGLLPAVLAYAFDSVPGKPGARTVACLNFAGLAPSLETLWLSGGSIGNAQALLLDPNTLPLAWAAALVGWALKECFPWLAQMAVDAKAARRRAELAVRRTELVEEWGEG
jgi:tetrahydromethanopterin S-methyltransferase subunit C